VASPLLRCRRREPLLVEGGAVSPRAVEEGRDGGGEGGRKEECQCIKLRTKVVASPLLRCPRREPLEEEGGAVLPRAVEGGREGGGEKGE